MAEYNTNDVQSEIDRQEGIFFRNYEKKPFKAMRDRYRHAVMFDGKTALAGADAIQEHILPNDDDPGPLEITQIGELVEIVPSMQYGRLVGYRIEIDGKEPEDAHSFEVWEQIEPGKWRVVSDTIIYAPGSNLGD